MLLHHIWICIHRRHVGLKVLCRTSSHLLILDNVLHKTYITHLLLCKSRAHPLSIQHNRSVQFSHITRNNGTKPTGVMPQHIHAQHTGTHIHSEIHKRTCMHACNMHTLHTLMLRWWSPLHSVVPAAVCQWARQRVPKLIGPPPSASAGEEFHPRVAGQLMKYPRDCSWGFWDGTWEDGSGREGNVKRANVYNAVIKAVIANITYQLQAKWLVTQCTISTHSTPSP